jgi:hypothetical protein
LDFVDLKYSFLFSHAIRIRSESNGWCPLNKISTTTYEYLQIDLVNLTVITLIELQGKFSQRPVGKKGIFFMLNIYVC